MIIKKFDLQKYKKEFEEPIFSQWDFHTKNIFQPKIYY